MQPEQLDAIDPRPTRVLLLRHAETAAPDRFHGAESDVPLGEVGVRQAFQAARSLALQSPTAVYGSALLRSRQTADAIARACGLETRIEPDLHERRMGPVSGQPVSDHRDQIQQTWARWEAGDLDATHQEAESYAQIRDRVAPILRRIGEGHPGETVVVVGHGMVIRVLITSCVQGFTARDLGRIAMRNVAVNDLRGARGVWTAHALDLDAESLTVGAGQSSR